jgi:hypothetical protein
MEMQGMPTIIKKAAGMTSAAFLLVREGGKGSL